MARLLPQFKSNWPPSFLFSKRFAIPPITRCRHLLHPDGNDITGAKLAVDRQIEHREVASAAFNPELRPDRPDVFWSQRRLCPCQLAFVPGDALWSRRGSDHFVLHNHPPRLQTPRRMGSPVKA